MTYFDGLWSRVSCTARHITILLYPQSENSFWRRYQTDARPQIPYKPAALKAPGPSNGLNVIHEVEGMSRDIAAQLN
jgi:hypothetical protein